MRERSAIFKLIAATVLLVVGTGFFVFDSSRIALSGLVLRYVGSVGLAVAGLYLWGGVCFLFFRFVRPETEARLLEFLKTHYDFYSFSFSRGRPAALEKAVAEEDIKRAGARGWWMTGLPIIGFGNWLNHKGSFLTPWLSIACLFLAD